MDIEIGQEVVVRGKAGRVITKRKDGTFDVDFGDLTRESISAEFIDLPARDQVAESPTLVEADDAPPAVVAPEPPLHIEPLPAEGEHAATDPGTDSPDEKQLLEAGDANPAGDQGDGSRPD